MYDALIAILVFVVAVVIVWQMVKDRGHTPWGWILGSLCWTPFGSMFVMWIFSQLIKPTPRNPSMRLSNPLFHTALATSPALARRQQAVSMFITLQTLR